MNNKFTLIVLAFAFTLLSHGIIAQNISVTMRLNTSTNYDTLASNGQVDIRGELLSGTIIPSVTWDGGTGIVLENIGGDYWETTFQMSPGSSFKYKFWTALRNGTATFFWDGWEGPFSTSHGGPDDNRYFVAGNSDTVVTLQFYHGNSSTREQYWRPYELKEDSVAVYFRVNMGGLVQRGEFDPAANGPLVVRGNAPLDWDIDLVTLSREEGSVNDGSFYSGVGYVAKADVVDGQQQAFKFVIADLVKWEDGIDDRTFNYTSNMIDVTGDTTITWYYFQDVDPREGDMVTGSIAWRLKLDALETLGLFDRGLGDEIMVIGAKGWDTELDGIDMTFVPALQEWNVQESFTLFPETNIIYKYFINWDTTRVTLEHENFIPGLFQTDGWEEPSATGGSDRSLMFTGEAMMIPEGDFGRDQQFFNSLPPEAVIPGPIILNFSINMTNATDADSNAANPLFRPGIDTAWVQFDGCLMPLTQGLTIWGTDNRIMLGDIDGDGIYTGSWELIDPTLYQAGYRIVYSSPEGEVWNGGGVQFGRRYYQFVHPENISEANEIVWPTEFSFPVMPWKAGDLIVEEPPDLESPTAIDEQSELPFEFTVSENYPNPFNPSTKINYTIPSHDYVKVEVFDITGSLVRTLIDKEHSQGNYSVTWNGRNNSGQPVSSGVYFLNVNSGAFNKLIKMMLLK